MNGTRVRSEMARQALGCAVLAVASWVVVIELFDWPPGRTAASAAGGTAIWATL